MQEAQTHPDAGYAARALEEVRRLNARHADFAGSRVVEARILMELDRPAEALEAGLAALRLDPLAPAVHRVIGRSAAAAAGLSGADAADSAERKLTAFACGARNADETALVRGPACLWG